MGALGQLWEGPVPGYAVQGTRYRVRRLATAGEALYYSGRCPVGPLQGTQTSGGWLPRPGLGGPLQVRGAEYAGTLQWVMP